MGKKMTDRRAMGNPLEQALAVRAESMRFAYADPPYLGCCKKYDHRHEEPWGCWDDPETHYDLIGYLHREFPDGWAMSASSPSLGTLLLECTSDVRVAAWVKPLAVYKPGVNPGYCWEPVLFQGGRRRTDRTEPTVRDFVSCNITMRKGLTGAKPFEFNRWIRDLLGVRDGIDELVDLFPGTGGMALVAATPRLAFEGQDNTDLDCGGQNPSPTDRNLDSAGQGEGDA